VPWIVPASALGRDGAVAPSERIVLGGIGIGRRGSHDLRLGHRRAGRTVRRSCDVWKERREAVKKLVDEKYGNHDCVLFRDMREFLEKRTDIDALLITTGDRWHATASVFAMRAGKDVYSEKPSSMTVAEGQAVVETARRYGRV
jgi:predicted dehydrogenase